MNISGRPNAFSRKGSKDEMALIDLLSSFDLDLTRPVSKSVRLNGRSTCIRLEVAYWRILQREARRCGIPVNRLLCALDLEVQYTHGTVINFSALVRVYAVAAALREAGVAL